MPLTIELTPASIDQASNRLLQRWNGTRLLATERSEDEGLYSWLARVAKDAVDKGEILPSGKYRHAGMKFEFIRTANTFGAPIGLMLTSIERVK